MHRLPYGVHKSRYLQASEHLCLPSMCHSVHDNTLNLHCPSGRTAPFFVDSFDELLLEIVAHLRSETPFRDRTRQLLTLGRVNRRLYNFVLPYALEQVVVHRTRSFASALRFMYSLPDVLPQQLL